MFTPDGKEVSNHATYMASWQALYKPIEQNLRLRLRGFDPTLSFWGDNGEVFQIDVAFAKKLIKSWDETSWKHCIVVKTSERNSIVAQPDLQTFHYEACTKPMRHVDAWKVCRELNEVDIDKWSDLTRESYTG